MILCFCHCLQWNCIISGGSDRRVRIWNDRDLSEMYSLGGHDAPVVGVSVCAEDGHLISCSADRVVKVWDLCSLLVLQTLNEKGSPHCPLNRLSAALYDATKKRVLTCGSSCGCGRWTQCRGSCWRTQTPRRTTPM